jgi:hypothetical protein
MHNPKRVTLLRRIVEESEFEWLVLSVNYFCRSATVIFAGRRQVDV